MVYENFLGWSEVDPNNKLNRTSTRAIWTDMTRNEVCYLWKTATTEAEFIHTLDFRVSSIDVNADFSTNFLAFIWVICETTGRPDFLETGKGIKLVALEKGSSTTLFQLYLNHKDDIVQDWSTDLSVGTTYYLRIEKSGAVVTCDIYSTSVLRDAGSGSDGDVDTLTIDLTGEDEENMSFSIFETTASSTTGGDVTDQSDGYIENLDFGLGPAGGYEVRLKGGSDILDVNPIFWKESQKCDVAIRPVPNRSGPKVDTGHWMLDTREIIIRLRLSDAEKTTLQTIFDGKERVTITTNTGWSYSGWLRGKPVKYEYRVVNGTLRPWLYELRLDVEIMNYNP